VTRTVYSGGLFVHELVTGERVVLYPNSHLHTHLGRLDFPPDERYGLMFLHCTNVPEFRCSGLAHDAIAVQWEWSPSKGWKQIPYLTGRTVYDKTGTLRDVLPAGYQFVNDAGEPVSRLVAYDTRNGLNEWTDTGGLLIGQGHHAGGVCVFDGAQLRVVDTGECYFVNVDRVEDQFCISYVRKDEGAIVVRGSRADLLALPVLSVGTPEPAPHSTPEPQPEPVTMQLPADVKAIRDRFVEQFPVPSGGPNPADDAFEDLCRMWTKRLAEQVVFSTNDPTWGVKNAGGGRPQSKDALARNLAPKLYTFDLLTGVGTGSPRLVTDPQGEDITGQVFMPVSPVNHLGAPTPQPKPEAQPPQPTVDLTPLWAALKDLQRMIDGLRSDQAALTDRLVALEQKPEPKYRVRGSTSRAFAHAHTIDLDVIKA